MGYIAKVDGKVTADEISMAEAIMTQMQLNATQRKAAIRLFNEGKKPTFALQDILLQFRQECHRRHNLLQMFLEIQIATAMADGHAHPEERKAIFGIGDVLGFDRAAVEHLFSFTGASHSASEPQPLSKAYKILGVKKDASDAEVKKAYRRMMSQHHPDRLIAKGLPEEMIKLATEKTQEIKAAYEQIKRNRG
jgi:DnaJ like chaperone protein